MKFPRPQLQIGFALRLRSDARKHLQVSLLETVKTVDILALDADLARTAPTLALSALAGLGIRGELAFATPLLLRANPRLLGYYRLLLGYSQKEFYGKTIGAQRFKSLELSGTVPGKVDQDIESLALGLSEAAAILVRELTDVGLTAALLNELTLLTLGAQFRGSTNNTIGAAGVSDVVALIAALPGMTEPVTSGNSLTFNNSAGRRVVVEYGADPDVTIEVALGAGKTAKVLAIEIKSGSDVSNIYNRLGEAEKSHIAARRNGFSDCWTIVNTPTFDEAKAKRTSPSTTRFYRLAEIQDASLPASADFRDQLMIKLGL